MCGTLTMTGGTINGNYFGINGPVSIHASASPSVFALSGAFMQCNTNSRITRWTIDPGATLT